MYDVRVADAYTLDTISIASKVTVLETACAGGCTRLYRIDEHNPEYAAVKAALDAGDRSVIRCYHTPTIDEQSRKQTLRDSPAAKKKRP